MPLDVLVFLSSPDLADNFKTLKKDDLLLLADHFQIQIRPNMKKAEIKTLIENKLMEEGLIEEALEDTNTNMSNNDTNFQMQLELEKMEIQVSQ